MNANRNAAHLLIIALLLGSGSAVQLEKPSCEFKTLFSLRSAWSSGDEPCHDKLSFELWTLMKAEGSAQNPDAQYVRDNCFQTQEVGLIELITPEGYTMSEGVRAAPGDVISETKHATTYRGATAATFEAFCDDENITRVTRVNAVLGASTAARRNPGRRVKSPTNEAGQVHQVDTPSTGPRKLGCASAAGEDCPASGTSETLDEFGNRASGELPQDDVVQELPR